MSFIYEEEKKVVNTRGLHAIGSGFHVVWPIKTCMHASPALPKLFMVMLTCMGTLLVDIYTGFHTRFFAGEGGSFFQNYKSACPSPPTKFVLLHVKQMP